MNTLNSKSIGRCIGCLCEESVSTFKLKSEPLRVAFQEDCLKLCYICKKLACNADLFVRTVQTNQLRLQSLINGPDITDLNIESHPILQLQTKIIDLHSHKINELTPRIEQTSNIRVKLEKNDERDDEVCDDIQDGSDNNAEFDLSLVKQEDVELSFLDKDETIDKCTLQYYKLEKNDERDDELCDDIQDGLDNNAECDLLLVKQEDVEQSFLDKDETIEKCKKKVLKGKTSTEQTSNIGVKLEKNDERDDEVCYEIQDGSDNNAVSTIEISPNPEESSNVVTVQVDVHHRHWSQLSASVATTNHVCVNETQATNDVSSIHPGYPKTAAERMREYRARKKKETLTVNHQKQRRSAAQRAKEYRIRKKMKIHSGEITTFNTMDPQAHVVSTSSTPMLTEDVLPSTSAIPPTVQHSANPAESNTLRNQITTLNMMDPCAHIPSTSSTPMETEDALPSTSAIPTTAEKNALRNQCDLLLVKQEDVELSFLDKDETIEKCKKKVLNKETANKKVKPFNKNTDNTTNETPNIILVNITMEDFMREREEMAKKNLYMDAKYKCKDCIKRFIYKEIYNEHMKLHLESNGKYMCEICKQRMDSVEKLARHKKKHLIRYKCQECGIIRNNHSTIKDHYTSVHNKQNVTYQCPDCSREFLTSGALRRHKHYRHKKNRITCDICLKSYVTKYYLRKHIQLQHSGDNSFSKWQESRCNYKCEECGKAFSAPSQLKNHMIKHSDTRSFYCVECNKTFKTEISLNQHLKTLPHVEYSELPLQCDQCDKRFRAKRDLANHMNRIHLGTKPYQCDKCEKGYADQWSLTEHIRYKHEGVVKPRKYPCTICDKVFKTNSTCKMHIRTHTGERPYKCTKCPASFSQSGILNTHVKLVHLKLTRDGRPKVSAIDKPRYDYN
ncbi:GDNF-inducible zinc finger protein 1-like isoform X5 [Pieris napi]|uniref:GDNF-inducible zinc finger protein 1-like isoform X5 n=1 Tax=Pieris napi TaxID=78633 RepID=UPI001FBBCFB2|nr:GDNF-inducible zinc finger protein 1-like isoform X5 [Pieris napi]